jgi:opacity protein-like surface antigen
MKKALVILIVFFFLGTVVASAQPAGKKWEVGGSFSFASFKFSGDTESTTVFNLPVRLGYYIWKGLEIEPEIMYTKFEGSDAGYLLSANFAYNFKLPSTANIIPFVLAGVGFGNGFSFAGIVEGDTSMNAFVYQFGAGAKFLVGSSAAFRAEYRFQHNELSETGFPSETISSHQILVGISIFF